MAINPRVAARREAEIAFLIEEDERLKYLGEKRKKEAAEKSAAIKEKDLPGYDPNKDDEELVFYSEDDKEEENDYPTFGKDFLETLDEDEPKYLSPAEKRRQKTSDSMFNTYNTGEEWLMSDGDDLAKGFINNFRSAIGTGVEDLAFAISDFAPWYKPAQNVVEKNTAGKIAEKAQNQFGNAKAKGVNGKVVDFLDNTSKNLGYSLLGFKAGDYAQSIGEGFDTYRKLREQGYSIEDATNKSLISAGVSLAGEKVLDKGGKWLNKQLPKGNVYGLTADTDDFVDNFDSNNYNRANEKGEIVNEFYDLLTDSEWADYYQKITEKGKLNSTIGDVYVWNGNGIIVISKRVRITGNTNDYQVIGYEFAENSYEVAQAVQKEINKSGGKYDARRIEEIIGSFSE